MRMVFGEDSLRQTSEFFKEFFSKNSFCCCESTEK
jgi:hypothetical protein